MINLVHRAAVGCGGCVMSDQGRCMRDLRPYLGLKSCVYISGTIDAHSVFQCVPPVPGIESKLRTLYSTVVRCKSIKNSKIATVKTIKKEVTMSKVKTLNPNLTRVAAKNSGARECNGCLFAGHDRLCMDPCQRARTKAGFGCQADDVAPDGYIYITNNTDLRLRYAQLANMEDQLKKAVAERRKLTAEIKAALQ